MSDIQALAVTGPTSHVGRVAISGLAPVAQRVRALQAEARALALQHSDQLAEALARVASLSAEIATGGEAYPVGVRELARRLAEDVAADSLTARALIDRARS